MKYFASNDRDSILEAGAPGIESGMATPLVDGVDSPFDLDGVNIEKVSHATGLGMRGRHCWRCQRDDAGMRLYQVTILTVGVVRCYTCEVCVRECVRTDKAAIQSRHVESVGVETTCSGEVGSGLVARDGGYSYLQFFSVDTRQEIADALGSYPALSAVVIALYSAKRAPLYYALRVQGTRLHVDSARRAADLTGRVFGTTEIMAQLVSHDTIREASKFWDYYFD